MTEHEEEEEGEEDVDEEAEEDVAKAQEGWTSTLDMRLYSDPHILKSVR